MLALTSWSEIAPLLSQAALCQIHELLSTSSTARLVGPTRPLDVHTIVLEQIKRQLNFAKQKCIKNVQKKSAHTHIHLLSLLQVLFIYGDPHSNFLDAPCGLMLDASEYQVSKRTCSSLLACESWHFQVSAQMPKQFDCHFVLSLWHCQTGKQIPPTRGFKEGSTMPNPKAPG